MGAEGGWGRIGDGGCDVGGEMAAVEEAFEAAFADAAAEPFAGIEGLE